MSKKGIMIVNLGTPDKPETKEVRAYLKRFLGDKRVIDTNRFIWLPILHGIILRTRPKKSAALYQKIWEEAGSPLLIYTKSQAEQLQARFPDQVVRYAMSYSKPLIPEVLQEMHTLGVTDLTVIPLYPQYSTTTTAPIFDEVAKFYLNAEAIPSLHFIQSFYDEPLYIDALANQIKQALSEKKVDKIIFSYHGIPVSYVKKGDPYLEHCQQTTQAVMDRVGDVPFISTFQSKFGPAEWLTPATDQTLKELPKTGVKNILILTPGFVSDCLETVEEIEKENCGYFIENGGDYFRYIHPFNEDPELIDILEKIVQNH
ncbi:ferrochelatase [Enterococcus moraviensis ATCC BAA-383]|uniref:Coproporphyrin III ferrochelatase n=1 Tax=Enterococcus moraviensis ATCC BAA-383 TaxID=1158609 RepID=R2TF69_9ENTE|nr:ferrochelatase [Enterococcus moraviensis]EOH98794.1 ferrochelatase [Enterococcus moraviensis ATCC BAA-383]EOT72031.1 ferrochelatase [Enterococcus moraviensis ATCC BAA-383]OJG68151.1 ferrochelatase [Enterococcus moraviensis]